jgi:ABC-type bacteriocin/lantibiotic exporter with double-glycine peptidase domain
VSAALARALIRDPAYLLLDEATGALDAESEADIIATLTQLARSKTIIAFTHSQRMMEAASTMLRLEDGCIASVSASASTASG